jgi:glycosyltransferase involved in cell wall biosynthesis
MRLPFVRDLGYVRDMPQAYHAADFTILGSLYEPFGLVGPESIRCGTRLIFEERIGCLPAINPGFVLKFSVHDPASIQHAVAQAIELAHSCAHHLERPEDALAYDPSPTAHARALLSLAAARYDPFA